MAASAAGIVDGGVDGGRDWGRFVRTLAACVAVLFALGTAFLLAVDPYDTGRGLIGRQGLHDQFPYTANASRARDPRFDAAIVGNSHIQALQPARLDALTGLDVVNLAMPATYTADILDVLRWYLIAHRPAPRAVVVGLDEYWCMPEAKSNELRFPRWLYAPRFLDYAAGLVRWRSFEAAQMRISHLLTGRKPLRPDGYWYYGPMYAQLGLDAQGPSYRKLAEEKPFPDNPGRTFPMLDRLAAEIARAPEETRVLLVRSPVYRTALPKPGSEGERVAAACGRRMGEVAAGRPHTGFLDLLRPGPDADDRDGYFDHSHYRDHLAVSVERSVAAALRELGATSAAPRT